MGEGDLQGEVNPVRVEIFVDGSNFHPALEASGITHPVAFGKLAEAIVPAVGGNTLVNLHYVAGAYPEPKTNNPKLKPGEYNQRLGRKRSTDQLYDRIAKEPNVTVWRETFLYRTPDEKDSRPVVEKGTDVRVALLMYDGAMTERYDIAVLIASDADFSPAVEMVRSRGKDVVWAFVDCQKNIKALVRKGARPFELTEGFLDGCRYVPGNPIGGVEGIRGRV